MKKESTIYITKRHKGEDVVYGKYTDFFLASILLSHPKKYAGDDRILTLTKEEFIKASKHKLMKSVVGTSANKQMALRNNFLKLPFVEQDENGNVIITQYVKGEGRGQGTEYTRVSKRVIARAFLVLSKEGKDAMNLIKVLQLICDAPTFSISVPYLSKCFGQRGVGTASRAKFNKLMDLIEIYYPEFAPTRTNVDTGNGHLYAQCLTGKASRLSSISLPDINTEDKKEEIELAKQVNRENLKKSIEIKKENNVNIYNINSESEFNSDTFFETNTLESDDKEVKEVVETIDVEAIIDEHIQEAALIDENEGQHTADEVEAGIDMANAHFEEAPQPVIENVLTGKVKKIDMDAEAVGLNYTSTSSVENVVVGMRRHNEKLMVPKYNSISSKKKNYFRLS